MQEQTQTTSAIVIPTSFDYSAGHTPNVPVHRRFPHLEPYKTGSGLWDLQKLWKAEAEEWMNNHEPTAISRIGRGGVVFVPLHDVMHDIVVEELSALPYSCPFSIPRHLCRYEIPGHEVMGYLPGTPGTLFITEGHETDTACTGLRMIGTGLIKARYHRAGSPTRWSESKFWMDLVDQD